MTEHVENPTLRPILGEQPAEPPATPGTVTVLLTIPWVTHVSDESVIDRDGLERHAEDNFREVLCSQCIDRLKRCLGVDLSQDIETTSTFVADQDPGDKR